jgi:hypothetical protein
VKRRDFIMLLGGAAVARRRNGTVVLTESGGYLIVADEVRESAIESTTGRQCARVNSAFGAFE